MRLLAVVCLSTVVCGCYVNRPLETPTPALGTRLHVQLTDVGSDSMARWIGPGVTSIDGRLVDTIHNAYSLSVSQVTMRSGQEQFWKGEQVALPRQTVASVQQHELSKTRSFLLGGMFILAAASLKVTGAVGGGNSGGGVHTGPK
jgi:hypothetical protein